MLKKRAIHKALRNYPILIFSGYGVLFEKAPGEKPFVYLLFKKSGMSVRSKR